MLRHILVSSILVSAPAFAGDEWQSPQLLKGSLHSSRIPQFLMVGTELRDDRCVAWVVADEPLVHDAFSVNFMVNEVSKQVARQVPQGCADLHIHFYRSVHDQPKNPSFRITEQLGTYTRSTNRTTFLGDDPHYGSWAEGPAIKPANMPWVSNAPRGEGYSIDLVAVDPAPGTPLKAGSVADFRVTLSYTLTVANKGNIVLVFQADDTGMIERDVGQMYQQVSGDKGQATLTDKLTVPNDAAELYLYVPLMPEGMRESKGQVIIRYPIEK